MQSLIKALMQAKRGENWREVAKLVAIALPVLLTNLCHVGIGLVDVIMAGRCGTADLAGVTLGFAVFIPIMMMGAGVCEGMAPMVSRLIGARRKREVGQLVRHAMMVAVGLGFIFMAVMWVVPLTFPSFVPDPQTAQIGITYTHAIMVGMLFNMMFFVLKCLNEGISWVKPALCAAVVVFLLNIPLNYIFIYGKLGLQPMGGAGCGVASSCVFVLKFAILFGLLLLHPKLRQWRNQVFYWGRFRWGEVRKFLSVGLPIGISWFADVLFFAGAALLFAPLGNVALNGHQIASNIMTMAFMFPLSVSVATGIRVGYFYGKQDPMAARRTIGLSYVLAVGCAFALGALVAIFRNDLAALYSADVVVIDCAAGLLFLTFFFQVLDAAQIVSFAVLRGLHRTKAVIYITIGVYWVVASPLAYFLARTDVFGRHYGVLGGWIAFIVGIGLMSLVMTIYARRELHRRMPWS